MDRQQTLSYSIRTCLVGIAIFLACADCSFAQNSAGNENPFPNRQPSPSLDGGIEWLNTTGPIDLKDVRGKIVLLDFWTYCCINCIHIMPDLKKLEAKYNKELVVIGVHSAKFDNEKETGNIRKAILRYEIEHPVVNDANLAIWNKFNAQSWPTFVLIDPEGFYCGTLSGEGNGQGLDEAIGKLATFHRAKGTLDERPIEFALERKSIDQTPLRFPGKILADEKGNQLFISDSNHNRIVVSKLNGELIKVIGSGEIGAKDGAANAATFDHPQGMALDQDLLYVADTENHLIRVIDLRTWTVSTLAGTGVQGHWGEAGGDLRKAALNSPWDLYVLNDVLYIAMAGPHQIWSYKIGTGQIEVFAGTGREDIINGSVKRAAFAQPSGITSDGTTLFLADAEGSSIRRVSVSRTGGTVTTVVGTSDLPNARSLFEFGDKDGTGSKVRLQHPLGVVHHNGSLYVADSYNHKIKQVQIADHKAETWLGTGTVGTGLNPVQLSEPAGLTIANNQLFIADTNNHRILVTDLASKETLELAIAGLTPPRQQSKATAEDYASESAVSADEVTRSLIGKTEWKLRTDLPVPLGYKLNDLVPVSVRFISEANDQKSELSKLVSQRWPGKVVNEDAVFELPALGEGKVVTKVVVTYGVCQQGDNGLCKIESLGWNLTLNVGDDESREVTLSTSTH